VIRIALTVLIASAALVAAASPAGALDVKRCGAIAGPTARIGTLSTSRYGVIVYKTDCGFAKSTVAAVLKQRLPNSATPVRAKAPSGWVCVAQEVDTHVAVTGHCQQGRTRALSWVASGLHP
jgi:hypothetical protein